MMPGREEQIRARAYEIWEREGHPADREHEHWEQARREISGRMPAGSPELQEEGGLSTAGAGRDTTADQGPPPDIEDPGNVGAAPRTSQKRAVKPKTSSKK